MFIVNITYKVSLNTVDKYLEEHVAYLHEQYDLNNFIASGKKNPRNGGIILSKVSTKEKLQKILEKDPFYKADLAVYEIIEFYTTLTNKEFENLKEEI